MDPMTSISPVFERNLHDFPGGHVSPAREIHGANSDSVVTALPNNERFNLGHRSEAQKSARPYRPSLRVNPIIKEKRVRKRDHYLELAANNWLWEALALWLSCMAFGAIVVILILHNNKPLPKWPFSITINALISTLAVVQKSSLLVPVSAAISQSGWHWLAQRPRRLVDVQVYDDASRGPWGSFRMLSSIRWRELGSIGALITILVMAIDPFVQQILRYEPGLGAIGNSSAIPARRLFDAGLDNMQAHPQITDSMMAAIYQGLFFTSSSNDSLAMSSLSPRPACKSGNCTYPTFETLAVCSKCAQIDGKYLEKHTVDWGEHFSNWSLPNGFKTDAIKVGEGAQPILKTSVDHDPVVLKAGLAIVNITAMDFSELVGFHSSHDVMPSPTAEECMLYWCVKKFQSSMVNGVLTERLINMTSDGDDDIGLLYHFKPTGSNATLDIDDPFHYVRKEANDRRRTSDENYTGHEGEYPLGRFNGTFLVNKAANDLFSIFFQSILNGEVTLNGDPDYFENPSNPLVQRLATAPGGIPAVFSTLEHSMTTVVRQSFNSMTPQDDNFTVTGTEFVAVTHVRVQWWWLALPVLLELVTVLFLLVTIICSTKAKLAMWKSSALALMLHGFTGDDLLVSDKVSSLVDMELLAKRTDVVLGDADHISGKQRLEVWKRADGLPI